MTIAAFALSEPAVAEIHKDEATGNQPKRYRTIIAKRDLIIAPEPR